jgi:peptidyl-prolyl cis-trans isomerase SurA
VDTASAPLRVGRGVLVLMVCEREQPKQKLPSREDIENQLVAQRLSLLARRYMRDLRYTSVVDMRL